jgi:hypothetical protein
LTALTARIRNDLPIVLIRSAFNKVAEKYGDKGGSQDDADNI